MLSFMLCWLLVAAAFLCLHFYLESDKHKKKYSEMVDDYNQLVRNRKLLKEIYYDALNDKDRIIKKHNDNVKDFNRLLEKYQALAKSKGYNQSDLNAKFDDRPVGANEFSMAELKRIQFACHPDKNGGKTDELWKKIRGMIENHSK
ncbi:hypothetical protein ACX818_001429 [Acinetobacter baumannii]